MVIDPTLERRLSSELRGRPLNAREESLLKEVCPPWLLELWRRFPITGARMYVDDTQDPTGIGVSIQWMNADEVLSELNDASPGREAKGVGYLPIGKCLEGSGDPYFVRVANDDSPLVRIPHAAARGGTLDGGAVEAVAPSLTEFLRRAKFR